MDRIDFLLYALHIAYWTAFGITRLIVKGRMAPAVSAPTESNQGAEEAAPFSRALVGFHMVAFGLMYFGIASAVLPDRVPDWFDGQRIVGGVIIVVGAILCCWTLAFFRSWRYRAKLDSGHQLATGGPFRFVRHPIYMGLNLLALGSAIWVPTLTMWIAAILMFIGSDLRGRGEETLLKRVFGTSYSDYCSRTKRFMPGIY